MSRPGVFMVAGEASGDLHAANLALELKKRAPGLELTGFGGSRMAAAGVTVLQDLVSHAVIGVAEALRKLGDFYRLLQQAGHIMQKQRPAAVVLIDFPDMNFRIAARARRLGIPVVYYISPQIWAWRPGRIKTLKRLVERMIVIFPFEEQLYRQAGIPVAFVGHPLLDLARPETEVPAVRRHLLGNAPGPLVSLLPGSRAQEIESLLPAMCQAGNLLRREFPGARFFVVLAKTVSGRRVEQILASQGLQAEIVQEHPYACRAAADLALVASGTATLETAILGVPMVIAYRMHWLSHVLARLFVKLPYFGLANVVAGRKAAPEFLQGAVTGQALAQAGRTLLADPEAAAAQKQAWQEVREKLGRPGAAGRAAEQVLEVIGLKTL